MCKIEINLTSHNHQTGCIPCMLYIASGSSTDWAHGNGINFTTRLIFTSFCWWQCWWIWCEQYSAWNWETLASMGSSFPPTRLYQLLRRLGKKLTMESLNRISFENRPHLVNEKAQKNFKKYDSFIFQGVPHHCHQGAGGRRWHYYHYCLKMYELWETIIMIERDHKNDLFPHTPQLLWHNDHLQCIVTTPVKIKTKHLNVFLVTWRIFDPKLDGGENLLRKVISVNRLSSVGWCRWLEPGDFDIVCSHPSQF